MSFGRLRTRRGQQRIRLTGSGDFDNANQRGSFHASTWRTTARSTAIIDGIGALRELAAPRRRACPRGRPGSSSTCEGAQAAASTSSSIRAEAEADARAARRRSATCARSATRRSTASSTTHYHGSSMPRRPNGAVRRAGSTSDDGYVATACSSRSERHSSRARRRVVVTMTSPTSARRPCQSRPPPRRPRRGRDGAKLLQRKLSGARCRSRLKIWRYDSSHGRARAEGVRGRRARGGDAPRLPRHRQGPARRHARLPQELPDDDLRLVRHAHGRRRRARVQDAHVRRSRRAGHVPGDLGDGQPADRQGPRRRHGRRSGRSSARRARGCSPATSEPPDGKEYLHLAGAHERHPQGVALHQLRLLRLRVQRDGVRPASSSARRRSRRRCASSATRATARSVERLEELQRRARHLGLHALLLLQRALPEGRRPARRDREARRRVDQARHRPRHGREAREVVRHARRRRPAGCARRSSCRRRRASSRRSSRRGSRSGSREAARCRCRSRRTSRRTCSEARALHDLVHDAGPPRLRSGSCRASARCRGSSTGTTATRDAIRTARARSRGRSCRARTAAPPAGGDQGMGSRTQADVTPGAEPTRKPRRRDEKVAYYKGCLASLSAKELDISTQALAPKLGLELEELESVTCCGAGDIHEAEPDYYLHLNARILAYAAATGADTLMTVCNVCTLNLRQANWQLQGRRGAARARQREPRRGRRAARTSGDVDVRHLLWLDRRGRGLRAAEAGRAQGPEGPEDRAVLRLPDPAAVEDPGLRGSRPAVVARADHRGVRRRGDRLPGEDQVLRLPDHPGARGDGARRADPADRAGDGGRRRRDGDAVPALPPLARRVAVEAARGDRAATSACRSCTSRS